jgi:phage terminase large subunit-like protein
MIKLLLKQVDPSIPYRKVTATRGKIIRAEPIASLSEQSRLHLVGGFPALEDQMCSYTIDSRNSSRTILTLVLPRVSQ